MWVREGVPVVAKGLKLPGCRHPLRFDGVGVFTFCCVVRGVIVWAQEGPGL